MAWLLNRSPTWRRFVEATKNPWTFVGVTIATCGVAYLAGDFAVKFVDSPTEQQVVDERFKELPVEQQQFARAQKQRLMLYLQAVRDGKDDEYYNAAMRGQIYNPIEMKQQEKIKPVVMDDDEQEKKPKKKRGWFGWR